MAVNVLILSFYLHLGLPSGLSTNIYVIFSHLHSKEITLVLSDWCLCHCGSLSAQYFEKG